MLTTSLTPKPERVNTTGDNSHNKTDVKSPSIWLSVPYIGDLKEELVKTFSGYEHKHKDTVENKKTLFLYKSYQRQNTAIK